MLCLDLEEFCPENIHFKNSTKNSIIPNGSFTYINYTTSISTLNTVYLILYKENVDMFSEKNIRLLKDIETEFLKLSSKIKQYKFCQSIDTYKKDYKKNTYILLKITGIWESSNYCGVSFKIIHRPNNF